MPRYFFDFSDNGDATPDRDGVDLPDLNAARQEALATLAGIAKDELPDGDRREFVIQVRDGSGLQLRASLSVSVERIA